MCKGQCAAEQTGTDTSDVQELEKASESVGEDGGRAVCCFGSRCPLPCAVPWAACYMDTHSRGQRAEFRGYSCVAFYFSMLVLMLPLH